MDMDLDEASVIEVHLAPEKVEPSIEIITTTSRAKPHEELSSFNYRAKQEKVLENYHAIWPWFFRSEQYLNWKQGRRWQLHCYSEPGCGKTTLAAEVARQLQYCADHEEGHAAVILLFLGHENDDGLPIYSVSDPVNVLWRTVLRQLVEILQIQDRPMEILEYFSRKELETRDIPLGLLKMRVNTIINQLFDKVYIVVDDIDHCSPDLQSEFRIEFGRMLKSYRPEMKTGIISTGQFRIPGTTGYDLKSQKLDRRVRCNRQRNQNCNVPSCKRPERPVLYWRCRTCNDEYDVCQPCYDGGKRCHKPSHEFDEPYHEVLMQLSVMNDELQIYIRKEIENACDKSTHLKDKLEKVELLKQAVESAIVKTAATSLVIARSYIDHLFRSENLDELLSVLDHVAQPEERYFGSLMTSISKQSEARSLLAFRILYMVSEASRQTACRHLDFEEIVNALTIHDDEDEEEAYSELTLNKALTICKGVLTVSLGDRNLLRTFHEDLAIYLYESDHDHFEDLDLDMTDLCLKALMEDPDLETIDITDDGLRHDLLNRHPFLVYASQCWGYHLKSDSTDQDLISKTYEFLQDKKRLAASLYIACMSPIDGARVFNLWPGSDLLHVAAFFNVVELLDMVIKENIKTDLNVQEPVFGRTPLFVACQNGSLEFIEALLKRGANPDIINRNGRSAVCEAVENVNGAEYIAQLFAVAECWPVLNAENGTSQDGKTPLMLSVMCKTRFEICDLLCYYDEINVNAQDAEGKTALMYATLSNNSDAVERLLERGDIDLKLCDANRQTVLHMAATTANPNIRDTIFAFAMGSLSVPILNQQDTVSGMIAMTALIESMRWWADDECVRIIRNLIQAGCDIHSIDKYGRSLMHHACAGDTQLPIVDLLHEEQLSHSIRDGRGWTPLHVACAQGATKVVSRLLEIGAETSKTDEPDQVYPSELARLYGRTELAASIRQYKLDQGQTQSVDCAEPLWRRIQTGTLDQKQTLSTVADEDILSVDPLLGHTALHEAVLKSDSVVTKTLLKDGRLDVDTPSHNGDTALALVVRLALRQLKDIVERTQIIKDLLSYGADVDAPDSTGMTPLSFARKENSQSDITILLIEYSSRPLCKGSDFAFLLTTAVRNKNQVVIEKILEAGGSMLQHNYHALLPVHVAEEPNDDDFLNWMKEKHLKATELFTP